MKKLRTELPKNPYNEYEKAVEEREKAEELRKEQMRQAAESKKSQMSLDFKKWLDSEINQLDMSGKMLYCALCPYSDGISKCSATQEQRTAECSCDKAYKKLAEFKAKQNYYGR